MKKEETEREMQDEYNKDMFIITSEPRDTVKTSMS